MEELSIYRSINMIKILFIPFLFVSGSLFAQSYNLPVQNDWWTIQPDESIEWKIDNRLPHNDHIEMSGEKVSLWMQYGVDTSGKSNFIRTIVCKKIATPKIRDGL